MLKFIVIYFFLYSTVCFSNFKLLNEQLLEFHNIQAELPSKPYGVNVVGKEFELDFIEKMIHASSDVEVDFEQSLIRSDQLTFDLQLNKLIAKNNVVFTYQDMILSSQQLGAFFPNKIFASQDVQFSYKGYSANANEASYNLDENVIVLTGSANLSKDEDFFRGEIISFDLNEEKVLSQGRSKVKLSTEKLP